MGDWITAGWSGALLPAAAKIRQMAQECFPGKGSAAMFGDAGGVCPPAAAYANAAISHLREVDDAHRGAMLHPGIVAIPPALALAARDKITRGRVLASIAAGYETALRVGEALGPAHSGRFHATATAGTLGAAAASAVALGLDGAQLHAALGIAATQAAGSWQFFDDGAHASKALHPAFAVRNGMAAAAAAKAGFPGARAFISGPRGLYALLHGDGPLEALDRDLGHGDKICEATIKAWPTCAQMFTALDAARALYMQGGWHATEVERVEVRIFGQALRIAGVAWPDSPAAAPFCIPYCLSKVLQAGVIRMEDIESPSPQDPGLQEWRQRIEILPEEVYSRAFPYLRPSTVTLHLRDGRSISQTREIRRGDPEDPYEWDGMRERAEMFAPQLDREHIDRIFAWCRDVAAGDGRAAIALPDWLWATGRRQ